MAEEKVSELLACPLCNVEMVETRFEGWDGNPRPEKWIVHPAGEHAACPIAALQFIKTPLSIAAWNRRTPTPVTEDVGDWVMVPRDKLQLASDLLNLYRAQPGWKELSDEFSAMLSASPSPPRPGEVGKPNFAELKRRAEVALDELTAYTHNNEALEDACGESAKAMDAATWNRVKAEQALVAIRDMTFKSAVSPSIKREA